MSKNIRIERWSGAALQQYIPELARLRIEVFREFPYLYDGDFDYEEKYLQTYIDCSDSVIVLAFDGDKIVGASTAMPMKYETNELKKPFIENGYNLDDVFYCSESVLNKQYRGLGIGVRFFADYVPLDKFWNKRGYFKHPELSTTYSWKDLDDINETPKPMIFWLKDES
jgi:hypothetical protein